MARAWAAWAGVAALRRAVIARLRDAARMLRPKGRALRAWQQNAHAACGACEAQLLVEP